MSASPHDLAGPIGIAGSGERAHAIAHRIAAGVTSGRILIHGIEMAEPAAGRKPSRKYPLRIERAATLLDLAAECAIVVTVYETHARLFEAIAGTAERPGLVAALRPDSLIADFTPAEPREFQRLAGQLGAHAVGFVECATARLLPDHEPHDAIFAGGFGEHIDRIAPLLVHLAPSVERSGPQGTARLVAAYCDVRRLLAERMHEEWNVLARAADVAENQTGNGSAAAESHQAELAAALQALRTAAAAHDKDVPFFNALAEALASSRAKPE